IVWIIDIPHDTPDRVDSANHVAPCVTVGLPQLGRSVIQHAPNTVRLEPDSRQACRALSGIIVPNGVLERAFKCHDPTAGAGPRFTALKQVDGRPFSGIAAQTLRIGFFAPMRDLVAEAVRAHSL